MTKIKICKQCHLEKSIEDFYIKDAKTGRLSPLCKLCESIRSHNRYNKNKEIVKEKNKKYYYDNHEMVLTKKREYTNVNKEIILERKKTYYNKNKEIISERKRQQYSNDPEVRKKNSEKCRKYKQENREKINKKVRQRYENDVNFKLDELVRRMVKYDIKVAKSSKNGESRLKYLPFSTNNFRFHIETQFVGENAWMTWDNHGKYDPKTWNDNDSSTWTWQLDHIIPRSDLPYSSMEDENFQKCWALENLRPLNAKQNLLDGVRRTRHKTVIKKVS
jgi:hypothetical protein